MKKILVTSALAALALMPASAQKVNKSRVVILSHRFLSHQ